MVSGRALKMYSWTAYKIFSGQKECLSKPPQTPLPMGLRLLLRRTVKLGWSGEHHLLKYIRIHSSHINIHALISIFIVLIMPRLKPIIVRFTWLLISSHHQTFKQVLLFYSLVVFRVKIFGRPHSRPKVLWRWKASIVKLPFHDLYSSA